MSVSRLSFNRVGRRYGSCRCIENTWTRCDSMLPHVYVHALPVKQPAISTRRADPFGPRLGWRSPLAPIRPRLRHAGRADRAAVEAVAFDPAGVQARLDLGSKARNRHGDGDAHCDRSETRGKLVNEH